MRIPTGFRASTGTILGNLPHNNNNNNNNNMNGHNIISYWLYRRGSVAA
jgi:hypothetical protein